MKKKVLTFAAVGALALPLFAATEYNYDSNEFFGPHWTKDIIAETPCYTAEVFNVVREITGTNWYARLNYRYSPVSVAGEIIEDEDLTFTRLSDGSWNMLVGNTVKASFGTNNICSAASADVLFNAQEAVVGTSPSILVSHDYSYKTNSTYWTQKIYDAALIDYQEVIATKQDVAAESVIAENLTRIEEQYQVGFNTGIAQMSAATNNMPTRGFTMGLQFPMPVSQTRQALEGYVADYEYDSVNNIDIFYLHLTKSLAGKVTFTVPYVCDSGMTTNRVTASFTHVAYPTASYTNVYTRTVGDVTYNNCHRLFAVRPPEYTGFPLWFNPVMKYGRVDTGITYSDMMVLTAFGGESLYTGSLTDYVHRVRFDINKGAIMATSKFKEDSLITHPDTKVEYAFSMVPENFVLPSFDVSASGAWYVIWGNGDLAQNTSSQTGTGQYSYGNDTNKSYRVEVAGAVTSVAIPDSEYLSGISFFTDIPANKCKNNTVVAAVAYGDSVTSIGANAFSGCTELQVCTSLSEGASTSTLRTIGDSAFAGDTKLSVIAFPATVTSIGANAFNGCTGLTGILCLSTTPPTIQSTTFAGVPTNIPVYVPDEAVETYQQANYWENFTDIKAIGE